MQRSLQLKYPNHVANLTTSRAEEMVWRHTALATEFFTQLRQWKDPDYYDANVRRIQLPFTIAPRPPPPDPELLKAKRQELARRLVEINAKKRDERLVVDESNLKQMGFVKDMFEQGYESKFNKALAKLNLGLTDVRQLELMMEKVKMRIDKAKESKLRAEQGCKEEKVEPEIKKKREDMDDTEKKDFDAWLVDIKTKFAELKERKAARQQRRQQLAKRRTAASQERMRLISQLARNTKKEDTFGMRDDDWEVYKQISKEGGDSDSEEEALRCSEYEAVLREHCDLQDEEVGRDNPEWHQIHLATETVRVPEILFQPSLLGSDQAGLAELSEFVLSKFPPAEADRLAGCVLLTGGLAGLAGLQERLAAELRCVRPAGSDVRVVVAERPGLDAWRGASSWASQPHSREAFLNRSQYMECGEGYLLEHQYSNRYFPTPPPPPPQLPDSLPCSLPSTPRTHPTDSSNPPSPHIVNGTVFVNESLY